jgi:predicted HAD superfamily phosphohydrolase
MGLDVKRLEVVRPGGGLVVAGAGCDAALQHADEAVGELMQRGGVDRTPRAWSRS